MNKTRIFPTLFLFSFVFSFGAIFSPASAATFKFSPSNATFTAECPSVLDIFADATSESSNSADLIVFFNPSEVTIIDADTLNSGIQVETGTAYAAYASNEVDTTQGRIRMTAFSIGNNLTENRVYARIPFQSKPGITSTQFTIRFDGVGETLDSNIANSLNSLDLLTSVTNANITFSSGVCAQDSVPPTVTFIDPTRGATGVPVDANITFRITDDLSGVDLNTVRIIINGDVYTADSPQVIVSGDPLNYTFVVDPINPLNLDASSTIIVTADDLESNTGYGSNIINVPPGVDVPVSDDDVVCEMPPTVIDLGNPFLDNLVGSMVGELGVSGTGALIAGFALLLSLLASIIPLLNLLNAPGILFSLLSFFLGKEHKKPWGLVLDAANDKPIPFATCRLYVAETTNLITQTVSDTEGRYGFAMSPGKYRLEISQNGYSSYTEDFVIPEGESAFMNDVRLVPLAMQQSIKSDSAFMQRLNSVWEWLRRTLKAVRNPLFILGFILSLFAILLQPNLLNYIIFALYVVTLVLFIISKLSRKPKFSSVVDSTTNLRIPYAVIKFYNAETWKIVDTQVTNANGQFDFFGDPGEYGILVAVRGYKFPSVHQSDLEKVESKYMGMLKAQLTKGNNKITLYLDPDISLNPRQTLEPAVNMGSPAAMTTPDNLPTPFN